MIVNERNAKGPITERKVEGGIVTGEITFRAKTTDERMKIASPTKYSLYHRAVAFSELYARRDNAIGSVHAPRIAGRRGAAVRLSSPSRSLGSPEKGVRRDIAKARRVSTDSRYFVGEMWNGTAAMPGP